jgi:allantoin racemase
VTGDEREAHTRVRYQSFVHPTRHAAYMERLEEHLAQVADPGTRFEVTGIDPPMTQLDRLSELRCAVRAIRNAIAAEREGSDAFVHGHFYDSGLYDMRATVDIPVVGLGEASFHFACTTAWRLAVVTIHPRFVPIIEEQVARYGLAERVVAVKAIETDPARMDAAFLDRAAFEEIAEDFRAEAAEVVAAGAEVILPGGGFPSLLFASSGGLEVDGARVLDVIAIAARWAQMAVHLRRGDGTGPSRVGAFAKPAEQALEEFVAAT